MKENKLKILHICTSDSGGAGLCCLRIHKSLLDVGVDSKVLTLNKSSKNIPEVYQYGRLKKYVTVRVAIRKALDKLLRICKIRVTDSWRVYQLGIELNLPASLPVSYFDLANHPLVKDADIIHLHWISNFVDYPSFFKNVNKPIVWTLHDENLFYGIFHYDPGKYKYMPLEQKYYKIKREAIESTGKLGIVFLSRMMHDQFFDNDMIKGRANTVINNPVDCSKFRPINKQQARETFGIPKETIVFLFVAGNISDPRKGLSLLSATLQRMNVPNSCILAVGGNESYTQLPLVRTTGAIYDNLTLSIAYSCADFFVMPSTKEAFAQTPIEAMACGIPAIVFPVSGTEELITKSNGVRAKGFSSKDLEDAIKQAMSMTYDNKEIRQDIINRFSPSVIAKKYIAFYERML